MTLDEKDQKIILALRKDARRPIVDLARTIGLSRTATHDRLTKLEERGVIRGYTVVVDDAQLPRSRAFFAIQTENGVPATRVEKEAAKHIGISAAYHLSGDVDLILQAEATNSSEILDLRERLATVKGVASIKTYSIMKGGIV